MFAVLDLFCSHSRRFAGEHLARRYLAAFSIMAVDSKKNEGSAENNVKTEVAKGEDLVRLNGEGELYAGFFTSIRRSMLPVRALHTNDAAVLSCFVCNRTFKCSSNNYMQSLDSLVCSGPVCWSVT